MASLQLQWLPVVLHLLEWVEEGPFRQVQCAPFPSSSRVGVWEDIGVLEHVPLGLIALAADEWCYVVEAFVVEQCSSDFEFHICYL